jgi:hypothetical protein
MKTLRELSAPWLPANLHRKFESAIVSGQAVEWRHTSVARARSTSSGSRPTKRTAA